MELLYEKETIKNLTQEDNTLLLLFEYNNITYCLRTDFFNTSLSELIRNVIKKYKSYTYYDFFLSHRKVSHLLENVNFSSDDDAIDSDNSIESSDIIKNYTKEEIELLTKTIAEYFDIRNQDSNSLLKNKESKMIKLFEHDCIGLHFGEIKKILKEDFDIDLLLITKWLPMYKYIFIGEFLFNVNYNSYEQEQIEIKSYYYTFSFLYSHDIIYNIKTIYNIIINRQLNTLLKIKELLDIHLLFESSLSKSINSLMDIIGILNLRAV